MTWERLTRGPVRPAPGRAAPVLQLVLEERECAMLVRAVREMRHQVGDVLDPLDLRLLDAVEAKVTWR